MFRPAYGTPLGSNAPALSPRVPRVAGFLRSATPSGATLADSEQRLGRFVQARGLQLAGIYHERGFVTLSDAGPVLEEMLRLLGRGQLQGVVTLASYTFSWDYEVVRFVEQRVAQLGGFVTYLYGR